MRKTHSLMQVALALMDDRVGRHWGYDLMKRAGVRSGVLYPVLQRMLADGWLSDGWEDPSEIEGGRPPRRYYELTDKGRRELGAMIADGAFDERFAALFAWHRGSMTW